MSAGGVPTDSLDAAWAAAEAAGRARGWAVSVALDGPGYVARAWAGEDWQAEAWSDGENGDPTPAAALTALAAKLAAR